MKLTILEVQTGNLDQWQSRRQKSQWRGRMYKGNTGHTYSLVRRFDVTTSKSSWDLQRLNIHTPPSPSLKELPEDPGRKKDPLHKHKDTRDKERGRIIVREAKILRTLGADQP